MRQFLQLRIRTLPTPFRPKGQETIVEIVEVDAKGEFLRVVTPLTDVQALRVEVDARTSYVTAYLKISNVALEVNSETLKLLRAAGLESEDAKDDLKPLSFLGEYANRVKKEQDDAECVERSTHEDEDDGPTHEDDD